MTLPRSALQIGIVASMTAPRDASVYCSPMLKVSGKRTNSTSPSSPNRSSRSHPVRRYLGATTSRIAASRSPPWPNRRTARLTGGTWRTATRTATTEAPNSTAARAALALARRSAVGRAFGDATEALRQIPIHRPQQVDCLNGSPTGGWRAAEHGPTAGADRDHQPAGDEPQPPADRDHRLHRRAVTPHQLRPVGLGDLGRLGRTPTLAQGGNPTNLRSQRRQCRHVGRGLRRRPRTGQRPDVDGDDPNHQDEPGQPQTHQGRATPFGQGRSDGGCRRSAPSAVGRRGSALSMHRSDASPHSQDRLAQLAADRRAVLLLSWSGVHWFAGIGEGPGSRAATAVARTATGRTPKGRPTGSSTETWTRCGPAATTATLRRGRVGALRGRPPRPWRHRRRSRPPWLPREPRPAPGPDRVPTRGG